MAKVLIVDDSPTETMNLTCILERLGHVELVAVARDNSVSPVRIVLAWLRAQASCVLPIPGASRLETLEDSLAAIDLTLGADETRRLDAAFA